MLLQPPKDLNPQQLAEREEEQRKQLGKLPRPTMASRTESSIALHVSRPYKEDTVRHCKHCSYSTDHVYTGIYTCRACAFSNNKVASTVNWPPFEFSKGDAASDAHCRYLCAEYTAQMSQDTI